MHRTVLVLVFAAGAFVATRKAEEGGANRVSEPSHIALEQVRLRAHFDSVLVELRARDVAGLTENQRAARAELTTWLAVYRDGGRFPLNDRYSDSLTPIFRDARGVTCAMAYLIERSGRRDILDRVASTRNLAFIRELADDSALVAWLDSVGFDANEAAMVQPTYGTPESRRNVNREYAVWSMMLSGASLATVTWNLVEPNPAIGFMGMIMGGLTVVAGLGSLNVDATSTDGDRVVGSVNLVTGGAAILAGIYSLSRRRSPASAMNLGAESQRLSWALRLDPGLSIAHGARPIQVGLVGRF